MPRTRFPKTSIKKALTTSPRIAISLALAISSTIPTWAQSHNHHDSGPAPEKLGEVSFPTSCAPASRGGMERGVALLHSFSYTLAQSQFEQIARADSSCAMAHWGIAMTQFQELWSFPDEAQLKKGAGEMRVARQLAAPPAQITPRERAYIEALSTFFQPAKSVQQRAAVYEAQMNALHRNFPDDVEGAAFDALSILAVAHPNDASLANEHQALAILQPLFASHPDHPGLAHYIIHTCDTPALAQEGLAAAREYARIAPSSPHALHMPGHIFARLGMWQEDIDSNLASVKASQEAESAGAPGAAHQMHADEFLVYAYLQLGADDKAGELTAQMPAISQRMTDMPAMDDAMKDAAPFFANELTTLYAIERRDWKSAAALKPVAGSRPYETFDIFWGQGIAAGHLHNRALAAAALAGLDHTIEALHGSLLDGFAGNEVQIMRRELLGWQAFAQGKPQEAVAALREAANEQDKTGQAEVDIPAREMLGDLLLLEHEPEAALREYRTALRLSPNRLNALLSAGQAAEQASLIEQARALYSAAVRQTHAAVGNTRPDLIHPLEVVGKPG